MIFLYLELMSTFVALVSIMMKRVIHSNTITLLKRHVKVFLTRLHHFNEEYHKYSEHSKHPEPIWLTSYNCLSLLNLPDMMQAFGCVRPLWECGNQGEGYVR